MNSLTVKILAALVAVLMLTTICTQAYYFLHDRHNTEEAVIVSINENVPFDGVVIRDEKVITYDGNGILDYQYSDGSKIAVNDTVASVYESEQAIIAKNKIAKINEQLTDLQRAQNPGATNFVKPEVLKKTIDSNYKTILSDSAKDDFSGIAEARSNLEFSMNVYNIVTDSDKNYNAKIKKLKAEKKKYEKLSKKAKDTIKASKTGYFVSFADGYESKLTVKNAGKLTEKEINDIVNSEIETQSNAVGKMFDSYTCKIAAVVSADKRITEDSVLKMMLSFSNRTYDVTVDSVTPCDDDSKSVVVLSCNDLDEDLVRSRVISAQLIFDEYTGIKVPRNAMRFQGDQKGVYVTLGKDISFKKIDVIYEGDDFVLSRRTSDEDYLLAYDQILLEVVSNKDVSENSGTDSKSDSGSDGSSE